MRGKGWALQDVIAWRRITPACAGKSEQKVSELTGIRDHPRVCGEKGCGIVSVQLLKGSPPRVRGKVLLMPATENSIRITPACAGKRWH